MKIREGTFARGDEQLEQNGLVGIPAKTETKQPSTKGWTKTDQLSSEERQQLREKHANDSIGVLMGTPLRTGRNLAAIDVDDDRYVALIKALLGGCVCGKVGAKGLTIFVQVEPGLKNTKLKPENTKAPVIEILAHSCMTVIPESVHPSGSPYRWVGTPLHEVDHNDLPVLTAELVEIIRRIVTNKHAWAIVEGGADIAGHDLMLKLTSCGVADMTDDPEWLADCLNALFHPDYAGNTKDETLGMLQSARKKGLGAGTRTKQAKSNEGASVSSTVLGLVRASEIEPFHDQRGTGYLSVPQPNGGRLNHAIRSRAGKDVVRRLYYLAKGKALTSQTLSDVVATLDANARYEGGKESVYLRIARVGDIIYIDLGRDDALVVRIDANGWSVTAHCPVRFYRTQGLGDLPVPVTGGTLDDFQSFLRLNEENWPLVLAYLINCLKGDGPFLCTLVEGEQGSGKSFLCATLKRVIDPNVAPKLRLPDNERDLSIHAKEHYLLVYDNISGVKNVISDALCTLATGGGLAVRRLYSDDELMVFVYCRPFILNGIADIAHRPDLLERAIPLNLPSLPEGSRVGEREMSQELEQILPATLGALYDVVAYALRNEGDTETPTNIRMADAARWILAAEPAVDCRQGTLIKAIAEAQDEVMVDRVINDAVVVALQTVLESGRFEGTVGTLLVSLGDHADRFDRYFPKTPAHLSRHLTRIKPSLEKAGIFVEEGPKRREGKMIHIRMEGQENDLPPEPMFKY